MRTGHRIAYGAALLHVLTAPALACPTGADLAAGIQFFAPDGLSEIHTPLEGDRIHIDVIEPGLGSRNVNILFHGVHLQWLGNIHDGGVEMVAAYAYPDGASNLPVPQPGLGWTGRQSEMIGGDLFHRQVEMQVGDAFEWQLGGCILTTLPVVISTSEDGQLVYREELRYMPDLGTAVLVNYTDSEGSSPVTFAGVQAVAPTE